MFYYLHTLLAPHIKKLETYFALFIFLHFRSVIYVQLAFVCVGFKGHDY